MTHCVVCGRESQKMGILMAAEGFGVFRGRIYCQRHNPDNLATPEQRKEIEAKLRRLKTKLENQDGGVTQPVTPNPPNESGTLAEFRGAQK